MKRSVVHQEFLWALGRVTATGESEVVYRLCTKPSQCYRVVVNEELLGTGWTGKALAAAGWKPVQVLITVDLLGVSDGR